MESLREILDRLSDDERRDLQETHQSRNTIVSRLIIEAMEDRALTREEFIGRHAITAATYNKSQSQAIDAVHKVIARWIRNPYDDIMLVQEFLFRGLVKEARKQFHSLEKEYARQGLYSVLDALYHEGVRVCYQTGDQRWLETLVEKIKKNSEEMLRYNSLNSPLILQMLKLEGKGGGPSPVMIAELERLREESFRSGHPVLIHNSLYCIYVYYTRHEVDIRQAHRIAREILDEAERNRESLHIYSITLAYNNYAHVLGTYTIDEDPEPYFQVVERGIGIGGPLEHFDFNFLRFQYYLFMGRHKESVAMYAKLKEMPQEIRFALLTQVAGAWLAIEENDYTSFTRELGEFYNTPAYQDFPEHDFNLRAMEIIFALRRHDYEYAAQKVDALRKFHFRKFKPAHDYRILVNALQRITYARLKGENATVKRKGEEVALRSIEYLLGVLGKA
jgi:hypothetical protein